MRKDSVILILKEMNLFMSKETKQEKSILGVMQAVGWFTRSFCGWCGGYDDDADSSWSSITD